MKKNKYLFALIIILFNLITSHAQNAERGPSSVDKTVIIILNKFIFPPKDSNSNLAIKNYKFCNNMEEHLFLINGLKISEENFIQLKCRKNAFYVKDNFYEVILSTHDSLYCIKEIQFHLKTKLNFVLKKQNVNDFEMKKLTENEGLLILKRKKRFLKRDFFEIELK